MLIREIQPSDDAEVAKLVRTVLAEFGADRPGFAWQDPELDTMSSSYAKDGCVYLVIELAGRVVGGGGIGPFVSEFDSCCELQKMYLFPDARGKGWGLDLLESLLQYARRMEYQHCYLESLETMRSAIGLYQKLGFAFLDSPLGDSGHNACDQWMLKHL